MTAVDQFRHTIRQAGLTVPDAIIADGKLHRFASNGDRSDSAGWYTYFPDEPQAGVFGCWRNNFKQTWSSKSNTQMTPAERALYRQRLDEAQRLRKEEERNQQATAAEEAQALWDRAVSATVTHPYLQKKQVQPHGLRVDRENNLIVPVMIEGTITSVQFINGKGDKKFLLGGRVKGGCFILGDLTNGSPLLICEGFATGASLFEATDILTVIAFNAGNLLPVARTLRQQFPTAAIVLAGDNDIREDGSLNVGLEAATAAATAIDSLLAMPQLDGEKCDWNDVHQAHGLEAVRQAVETVLPPVVPHIPFPLTDVGNAERFAFGAQARLADLKVYVEQYIVASNWPAGQPGAGAAA